jgi:multidrug resistance efflux pump
MKPEFTKKYSALNSVFEKEKKLKKSRVFAFGILIVITIMFLPWNQTVITTGKVSTLYPNQRPQGVNSVIPGKIKEWKVREGDLVLPGDTLVLLTETKEKYFDSSLITRMKSQIKLKSSSVEAYQSKVTALDNIITSLKSQLDFKTSQVKIKLEQTKMKLYGDSISYVAKRDNYEMIQNQFRRYDSLNQTGIVSNTSLENRRIKMQQSFSYMNDGQVKLMNTRNDLNDLKIELQNIKIKFRADQDKILSDKLSSIGLSFDTENQVTKLQNELENYIVRNDYRVVIAETEGYITNIFPNGKGETVKEGEKLLTIMPINHELTGEIYISPMDIPLIHKGEKVQVQFDGWPSIVFSGWPDLNYGSFVGEIYAIDQFPSSNGKFRVLVKEVPNEKAWPKQLSFGSGIRSTILLNKVAIGYELWRKTNGFPADFYAPETKENKDDKK